MPRFLLIILCVLLLQSTEAATRRTAKTVRQEQAATKKKIDNTKREIQTNIEETRKEYNRLLSIEGEIEESNTKIAVLTRQTDSLTTISKSIADSVGALEARVDILKNSYAKALQTIRKQRHSSSTANFIFSAGSVSDAMRRIRYLKQLGEWQTEKGLALKEASSQLTMQKARLDSTRTRLNHSLAVLGKEHKELLARKEQASTLVISLKRQGGNLNKILTQQQQLAKKLDEELDRIIAEEARKAAEEAAKQQGKTPPAPQPSGPKETVPQPTTSFAENKGKLPLPIDRAAKVTGSFGRHTHAELSKVELVNNGIDFETTPGASAVAVFPGTVSMVIVMDGYHNVVLIRHGEYLTVYAGIDELKVRKGQQVRAGELLGTLHSDPDDDNRTKLHFEVRKEKDKLNPAEWLK